MTNSGTDEASVTHQRSIFDLKHFHTLLAIPVQVPGCVCKNHARLELSTHGLTRHVVGGGGHGGHGADTTSWCPQMPLLFAMPMRLWHMFSPATHSYCSHPVPLYTTPSSLSLSLSVSLPAWCWSLLNETVNASTSFPNCFL